MEDLLGEMEVPFDGETYSGGAVAGSGDQGSGESLLLY